MHSDSLSIVLVLSDWCEEEMPDRGDPWFHFKTFFFVWKIFFWKYVSMWRKYLHWNQKSQAFSLKKSQCEILWFCDRFWQIAWQNCRTAFWWQKFLAMESEHVISIFGFLWLPGWHKIYALLHNVPHLYLFSNMSSLKFTPLADKNVLELPLSLWIVRTGMEVSDDWLQTQRVPGGGGGVRRDQGDLLSLHNQVRMYLQGVIIASHCNFVRQETRICCPWKTSFLNWFLVVLFSQNSYRSLVK